MSVELDGNVIRVRGTGRIEDAETLAGLLQTDPGRRIDLAGSGTLHTAVVQVLLAFRPTLEGSGDDDFVNTWLLPTLRQPPSTRNLDERDDDDHSAYRR